MTRLLGLWRRRLRATLVTGLLLAAVTAGWLYLAPARIGGSTTYVVTSGISMHPRFHSGDLAIVRPAARYRVGEVAAYRSSLLHVIVLHRIVAIAGGRYTFKGDNNSFVDPVRPTRAAIVGALWFRVPHGGRLLSALHSPVMAALLAAGATLLLLGFGETRRRQRRGRGRGAARGASMPAAEGVRRRSLDPAALLATAGAVTVVFLALAFVAFLRPTVRPATRDVPYTQQVRFSYHAAAPAGPVYPSGAVTTGDPIFTQLVHRLSVSVDYRLASAAPAGLHGTAAVALQLTGPTGWSRTIALARRRPFTGGHVTARVALDLRSVQSLLAQVERLTGVSGGGYALAVVAHVHVAGRLGGRPLTAGFDPSLAFQVQPLQLQLGAGAASGSGPGAGGGSSSATGLSPSRHGAVVTRTTAPSTLGIGRAKVSIARLRAIGLIGLAFGLVAMLVLGVLTVRRRGFDESARIGSRYGHLIVPISAGTDLGWPAIDVTSMRALARLAECSGQLVLHNHDELTDTYLVNDEGTVYRYQVKLRKVVWGEWSAPTVDLAGAPEPVGAPGGD